MKRTITGLIAVLGIALTGCAGYGGSNPGPAQPPPATADTGPQFTCTVNRTGGATPAVQFTVTATDPGSSPVTISIVSVAFTGSGQELASNNAVPFGRRSCPA